MANLEVSIGADNSELLKGIREAEKEIKELESQKGIIVKAGLDTTGLDKRISESKTNLESLRKSLNSTAESFASAKRPMSDAGNTLNNFSRIAQDAPFGIMGIGNNITATAEAFGALSKQSGGAGAALKAVGASLMGPGGVLLAVSLVTTALTVMSQKGLTVGDVFKKMSGTFDEFKASLQEVNKEAAKNAAEQVQSVKSYVSAAKNINLSMEDRLIAVKKLQNEFPAFFGNLTKEQILNGNIANAVRDVTAAIKAKARAQAAAGKLGDLASKEIELRDREAELIKQHNETLTKRISLEKQLASSQFSEATFKAWQQADRAVKSYSEDLKEVQADIRANISEMDKWSKKSEIEVAASVKLDFQPEKVKKVKEEIERPKNLGVISLKLRPDLSIEAPEFDIQKALGEKTIKGKDGIFTSLTERLDADREAFIKRLQAQAEPINMAALQLGKDINTLMENSLVDTFGGIGTAIGEALVTGANVVGAVGQSIISSLGKFLSDMGGLLIQYGTLAVVKGKLDLAILTGGPVAIGAGLAAIGVGIALKAAGGALGSMAKGGSNNSSVSAGNSVSTPTSSISGGSSFSGGQQTVVFEISGQSLVGVLSNTLNKNVKLGGTPAI